MFRLASVALATAVLAAPALAEERTMTRAIAAGQPA